MGAHVMGPAYLRDHLLPNWQLNGWSNYWYAGFPMYRFYMVVPALMIVALNTVFSYGVAFKIVAVSGVVTLPLCCFAFGRLAAPHPRPTLFAPRGCCSLRREFSTTAQREVESRRVLLSIALSLAISFRPVANGSDGRSALGAIVLALAALSHGIVAISSARMLLRVVGMTARAVRFTVGRRRSCSPRSG